MNLDLMLEYAVGDIRTGVLEPYQSSKWRMVYYTANPTLHSMLDLMDSIVLDMETKRISPTRYLKAPFGHTLRNAIQHITTCSNSMYNTSLTYEMVSAGDWFRDGPTRMRTSVSAMTAIRIALLVYIQKEDTHHRLDGYICDYLYMLIQSIIDITE